LAREGEVIDDAALQAYIELFSKPMTQQHISACLALFGWPAGGSLGSMAPIRMWTSAFSCKS
jgi:hypothetical protein